MTRILVVDDSPISAAVVEGILTNAGFEVEVADSGEEALARLKGALPALVVSDLVMPGIDGHELCRRAREEHTLPFVFLTGSEEPGDRAIGLAMGQVDYLTKPPEAELLVAAVRKRLRLRRS